MSEAKRARAPAKERERERERERKGKREREGGRARQREGTDTARRTSLRRSWCDGDYQFRDRAEHVSGEREMELQARPRIVTDYTRKRNADN